MLFSSIGPVQVHVVLVQENQTLNYYLQDSTSTNWPSEIIYLPDSTKIQRSLNYEL